MFPFPRRMPAHRRSLVRSLAALALTAGLLSLGLAGTGSGVARADGPPNGITVQGSGSAELPPDEARVSGSVETQAGAADDALNQNSQTMQAVLAAIRGFGISDSDVSTTRVTVNPVFSTQSPSSSSSNNTPTIVGYRATNGVEVKLTDLNKVGDLIQAMVSAGINDFSGVSYDLQNPEQLQTMSLQAAIADGQQQAQAAAAALGVKLGGVLNMSSTSNTPPVPSPRFANAAPLAAAAAPPPVLPGPQTGTTTVTITYAILGS
jgi:uncharacterized protein YggE